ncbi:TPA: hypothetical protein N0F65_002673, partial [Lagenidium giganteum]
MSRSGDDEISSWKLFNDLENREEANVLELSAFLNALHEHMPGVNEEIRRHEISSPAPVAEAVNHAENEAPTAASVSVASVTAINIADMYCMSSKLSKDITLADVKELVVACSKGWKVPRQTVVRVVTEATALFQQQPTLVDVSIQPAEHITIVGDLHGQLDDLILIFRENGLPSPHNPYVFNGDFVDRGDRGVEITVLLYMLKLLYPAHVHINRGNHEEMNITQVFGFMRECVTKYDFAVYELICESFRWLPLATLLDERVLVIHAGVPRDAKSTLADIRALERRDYNTTMGRKAPTSMTLMRDLLWSDPFYQNGWKESQRGAGIYFGSDVAHKFMAINKLTLVVRSHECVPMGFDWPFGQETQLVTLFSASNYCGKSNNLGCFVRVHANPKVKPEFMQYMAEVESRDLGVTNLDALCSLIVVNHEELLEEFERADTSNTGTVAVHAWASVMEDVLELALDWKALQPLLVTTNQQGLVEYREFLERYTTQGTKGEDVPEDDRLRNRQAFNALYRHRDRLEALFRVLDRDGNGVLTLDELESGIALLNAHLPPGTKPFITSATDLMQMLDFSQDNVININEFLEGFRLKNKLTIQAKWKRARKKITTLRAFGALRFPRTHSGDKENQVPSNLPSVLSPRIHEYASANSVSSPPSPIHAQSPKATEKANRLLKSHSSGRQPLLLRYGSVQLIGPATEVDELATYVEQVNIEMDQQHHPVNESQNMADTTEFTPQPISPQELVEALARAPAAPAKRLLVIDVREVNEVEKGYVVGAANVPSGEFQSDESVNALIAKYAPDHSMVVFYCNRSLGRGPRCAKRFGSRLQYQADAKALPEVKVLAGGFQAFNEVCI